VHFAQRTQKPTKKSVYEMRLGEPEDEEVPITQHGTASKLTVVPSDAESIMAR
jgi:hypothetical protein